MTLGLAKGVVVTAFFCLLFCALVPVIALVYGEQRIVLPGLVLALTMPLGALQVPIWVLYRREPAPL